MEPYDDEMYDDIGEPMRLDRDDLRALADIVETHLQSCGRSGGREARYPVILRTMAGAMLHDDYIKTDGRYVGTVHG